MKPSVLIGYEFSATVRDAFLRRGFDAWSCDLLPTEGAPENHFQGDIWHLLNDDLDRFPNAIDRATGLPPRLKRWELAIFHPPCTYLANSGVRWLTEGGRLNETRWQAMESAAEEFSRLLALKIPRICVENPVMHGHGMERLPFKWEQRIQPYDFGHAETKATCLWLVNLPRLQATDRVKGPIIARVHRESPGPDRWKNRSRTPPGIAEAFAEQWGPLVGKPIPVNPMARFLKRTAAT